MLPFDRFVRAIDEWGRDNPSVDVFLQIGDGKYEPRHVEFARIVSLSEYRQRLESCNLFVAHVGMGSILQAMEVDKQMLLMVRDVNLGEHTTDHQTATASRFHDKPGITIVKDTSSLKRGITDLLKSPTINGAPYSSKASPNLLNAVRTFLHK